MIGSALWSLWLWVALGSAAGGLARFLVSGAVSRALGGAFPWGTLAVNVTGSFGIGLAFALAQAGPIEAGGAGWGLAVTGFLGSYTTVSSLSLETLALLRAGEALRAAGSVAGSLLLGFGAVLAGMAFAGAFG